MKILIDEAPAGPALDAAVAEALGCKVTAYPPGEPTPFYCGCGEDYPHGDAVTVGLKRYSADIAAAWEMEDTLEEDRQSDYVIALFNLIGVVVWGSPDYLAFSKAVHWRMIPASPLDRCRAFLKANGVTHVEAPDV